MPRWPGTHLWAAGIVLALYAGAVLAPVLVPFATLIEGQASPTLPSDADLHAALMGNSLKLAGTVTAAAVLLAVPLALLFYRTRLPLRSVWLGAILVPPLVPPYVLGTGVLHLLTPKVAVGFTGAAVTMTLWLAPLALLFAGAGLRLVTRAQEEAALLDTTWPGVLRHVTVLVAFPHIAAGALFVFILALGEFGVPVLFQYRVYPGAIFAQFAAFYDFRQAVLTAVPLLVVVVLAALLAQRVLRGGNAGTAENPVQLEPGPLTVALALIAASCSLAALTPLLKVAAGVGSLTALVAAVERIGTQALRTFGLAALGALGAVFLGMLVAWAAVRLRLPGGRALVAAQLPLFAAPAVLVGLGLIRLWNEPGWRGLVYTSPLILALGYLARFTPILIPLVAASYRQLPEELDEAAALDGASPLTVIRNIHAPLLRPVLGAAGLLAFVLAVGEVPMSMLVAPPGQAPLAVRFFTLITNAPAEQVAALSVITTLLALLPVTAWLVLESQAEGRSASGSGTFRKRQ